MGFTKRLKLPEFFPSRERYPPLNQSHARIPIVTPENFNTALPLASLNWQSDVYPAIGTAHRFYPGTNVTGQCCKSPSWRPAPKNEHKVSIWWWHFLFLAHGKRFGRQNAVFAAVVLISIGVFCFSDSLKTRMEDRDIEWTLRTNKSRFFFFF